MAHRTDPVRVTGTIPAVALCCFGLAAGLVSCGSREDPNVTSRGLRPAEKTGATVLADTSWRLVEFASMDDATGVKRPDDPSRYTMELAADGTVAFRLDCNRATGTWEAAPAGDGTSGTFRFGPLAATSALCPPPSLDEWIRKQAPYVRGYLRRDGNLYLSLMADGGVFAWAPLEDVPSSDSR